MTKSLFAKILKLSAGNSVREEDAFTEVVAEIFRNNHELLLDWLREIGSITNEPYTVRKISTQEQFPALKAHFHKNESRPDMVIQLIGLEGRKILFIESKIGIRPHLEQLQKYADHLKFSYEDQQNALVLVTRDYERPWTDDINLRGISFTQCRWSTLASVMERLNSLNPLEIQLIKLMDDLKILMKTKLTFADLLSLEQFNEAKCFLESVVEGKRFVEQLVKWAGEPGIRKTQLVGHRRIVRQVRKLKGYNYDFHFGTWLPDTTVGESVLVGFQMWLDPKSKHYAEVQKKMIEFKVNHESDGWDVDDVESKPCWFCLWNAKPIQSIVTGENHIDDIENWLLELIVMLEEFKTANTDLPW